jgi:hypothetical protein
MKTIPALTLQFWEWSPSLDPHIIPSVISTEPHIMVFVLSWVFLVAIFKDDL